MLTQMRKGASSWPAKVLLIVIALSFVAWGMGGVFTDRNVNVVAQVGDVDVEIQRLQIAYNQQSQQFENQGFQIEPGGDLSRAIAGLALEQLVQDALYRITGEELGVTINDETVRADIASNGLFQDDQGRFDGGRFLMLLQNNGLSEAAYVNSLRGQIADSQLQNGIGAVPLAPDAMVDLIYDYRFERRVAEFAVIPNDVLAPTVEPSQDELDAYFADHADRYQAPEYRSAEFIAIYPSDLAAEMTATEEELRQFYETNEARWIEPEKRDVRRMAFATLEEAQAASDRVAAGEDFDAVAADMGADVLDLGTVGRSDLFGDLTEPIFALEEGLPSAPIASPLGGYLVAQVTAIEPEMVVGFDEAREDVAQQVALEKAYDAMYDVANDLDDMLASGDSIADAAATLGLSPQTVTRVDASGNAADPLSLQVIPDAPEFLPELFTAEQGFASPVIETANGGLLALEVTGIEAARPLTFEEAQERVAQDWRTERQAELAQQAARDAVANLDSARLLANAFVGMPVSVSRPDAFRRSEAPEIEGLDTEVVTALFDARPGEVVVMPAADGEAQVVARLVAIEPADASGDEEGLLALRDTLTSAMISDLGDQFRLMMRNDHEISIDQAMVEQYF